MGAGGGADKSSRPGAKPQLRVYIPGQKEFVPRTVSVYTFEYMYMQVLIDTFFYR